MKWFISMDGPVCGVEEHAVIEADSEIEAADIAYEMAIEHMQSFFHIADEDEEDLDEEDWGGDWIRFDEVYSSVEKYNPEEHDGYLSLSVNHSTVAGS
jgi:hypothetical protein